MIIKVRVRLCVCAFLPSVCTSTRLPFNICSMQRQLCFSFLPKSCKTIFSSITMKFPNSDYFPLSAWCHNAFAITSVWAVLQREYWMYKREKCAVPLYCAGLQNQGRLTRHRAALSFNPVFWFQIAFLHLIFTSKMTNMNTEVGI